MQNIKVSIPFKLHCGLTRNYPAICHLSYYLHLYNIVPPLQVLSIFANYNSWYFLRTSDIAQSFLSSFGGSTGRQACNRAIKFNNRILPGIVTELSMFFWLDPKEPKSQGRIKFFCYLRFF